MNPDFDNDMAELHPLDRGPEFFVCPERAGLAAAQYERAMEYPQGPTDPLCADLPVRAWAWRMVTMRLADWYSWIRLNPEFSPEERLDRWCALWLPPLDTEEQEAMNYETFDTPGVPPRMYTLAEQAQAYARAYLERPDGGWMRRAGLQGSTLRALRSRIQHDLEVRGLRRGRATTGC